MAGVNEAAAQAFGQLVVKVGTAGRAHGLTLGDAIRDLLADGMSPENVEAALLADLNAGGRRYFGPMIRGIREATLTGVDRAMDAIEIVAYDDKITAAAKALNAGEVAAAKDALKGISKADMGRSGADTFETWITVMDNKTCPDCGPRHRVTMTRAEWSQVGRPRWGTTVCGPHCRCKIVPAAAAAAAGEDLREPVAVPRSGEKVKV